MNENDVMRVGGRVSMAPISDDAKNPMILPKDQLYTSYFRGPIWCKIFRPFKA